MIPILILAAGQSSRMQGRDKLLEIVDGVPLVRRQAETALATGHSVFVAVQPDAMARKAAISDLPLTILNVAEAGEGISGTMRGAAAQLPSAQGFMIVLGDLVALRTEDLSALFQARKSHPDFLIWRGATEDGKPGHPIIFDESLRSSFARLKGDSGGEPLVKSLQHRTYLLPLPGQRARFDLDTPQDWAAWRSSND